MSRSTVALPVNGGQFMNDDSTKAIAFYDRKTAERLERRAGIEPANTGFADLRVDRFATGAWKNLCFNTS